MYEAEYCDHCVHQPEAPDDGGCPILLLHGLYNYDECNNDDSMLHVLIPRTEDGIGNKQCTMFIRRTS